LIELLFLVGIQNLSGTDTHDVLLHSREIMSRGHKIKL